MFAPWYMITRRWGGISWTSKTHGPNQRNFPVSSMQMKLLSNCAYSQECPVIDVFPWLARSPDLSSIERLGHYWTQDHRTNRVSALTSRRLVVGTWLFGCTNKRGGHTLIAWIVSSVGRVFFIHKGLHVKCTCISTTASLIPPFLFQLHFVLRGKN